jgi:hypothetical protein|tara:strand:- start:98 stop:532 length:435 start_codon:yes stop_codon:yes gene_type:complete
MSPLELIKNGILENDLEKVIQGYTLLTGEEVRPNKTNDTTPREAEEVQSQVPVRSSDLDFTVKRDNATVGKGGRKEAIQVGENQFVDDGLESKGEEFKTPEISLTPRRKPIQMVEVICNSCGSKEEVNPAYKTGSYHRCSRCVG